MMSRSLGCRNTLCQTGCINEGHMIRERFNSDLLDEWHSLKIKYLSDFVFLVSYE